MKYRTILAGTDGSESSLKATDRAAEIAARDEARLIVVCAYHPLTVREQSILAATLGPTSFFQVAGTEVAERVLATAVERAREVGAPVIEAKLIEGDPGQALISVAKDSSADLIVMGNRGINTLSGRLLGSVPSDVTQRAPCDVLIVHTTEGGRM